MSKLLVPLLAAVAFLHAFSVEAAAVDHPHGAAVIRALGHCNDPCTIRHNSGGSVADFEDAADAIRAGARSRLIIDGYCGSSCMVLADRARSRTCITERAVFGYHKTSFNRSLPLRGDLQKWIAARGGFPDFGGRVGLMSSAAARQFWTTCSTIFVTR